MSDRSESPHRPKYKLKLHPTCSDVTVVFGKKSLNNVPHLWYSGVTLFMRVIWVMDHLWQDDGTSMDVISHCLWVLYEAWTMSDRGESPHIPMNDLQLHPWHAQLLPWFSIPGAWTMHLVSTAVVKGWWYMYVYAITLFHECCMMHGLCLTGMNHPTDHTMTSNYTPDMLSYYSDLQAEVPAQCNSSMV